MVGLILSCMTAMALDAGTVEQARDATVMVETTTGSGSGFFVRDDWIVTNAHVVGDAESVRVRLDSGSRSEAQIDGRVLRRDDDLDLALIEVGPQPGRALELNQDAPLETSDVTAAGFPLGRDRAMTRGGPPVSLRTGSVTALHRVGSRVAYIEHNANMTHGSSGGPLIDSEGHVVGVNVAMLRRDESTKLAIPSARLVAWLTTREAPVIHHPIARVFQLGIVAEVAALGGGDFLLRYNNGGVDRVSADASSSTELSGIVDLAVDDRNGTAYAVTASGALLRRGEDGWATLSEQGIEQVAATGHAQVVRTRDGRIGLIANGDATDLGPVPADAVYACTGSAYVRRGTDLYGLKGNGDLDRLVEDVTQVVCAAGGAWALDPEGRIWDLNSGDLVDRSTHNTDIWATPGGVLARTTSDDLWMLDPDDGVWSRVEP